MESETPAIWLVWYLTHRTYPWPLWSTPAWALGLLFHYPGVKHQAIIKQPKNNQDHGSSCYDLPPHPQNSSRPVFSNAR